MLTRYRVGAISRGLGLGRRVLPDRVWDAAMRLAFRPRRREAVAA